MSTVSTRNTFPPNTKIAVHPRTVDFFDTETLGDPAATATTGDFGDAEFSGLPDGNRYWLVAESDETGQPQVVGAVAKGADVATRSGAAKKAAKTRQAKAKSRSAAAKKGAATKKAQAKAQAKNPSRRVVSGSRGTRNANPRSR